MEQDTSHFYNYDSVPQELALELLGSSADQGLEKTPELPCIEYIVLQPLVLDGESHMAEAVAGEPGLGAIVDRRLPIGDGFMEINLSDSKWFSEEV